MLETIIAMMSQWQEVFSQRRTLIRAIRQAVTIICVIGTRTIARCYLILSQDQDQDWSADYKLHSRSHWDAQDLFTPVLKDALELCPDTLVPIAIDDTRLSKTGKKIKSAFWGRDPMGPPFHLNLKYGIRYLHAALLLPLHHLGVSARALPIFFDEVRPQPKPGKKATDEEKAAYRKAKRENNLCTAALAMINILRQKVDLLGGKAKILVFPVDGSFTNKTLFKQELDRVILIGRTRKDAKLCFRSKQGRKLYDDNSFTPEQVRKDPSIAWQKAKIFHTGQYREVEYKEVKNVLWRRGSGTRPLRLLVVKATPYRKTKKGKFLYRQPAYLLITDLDRDAEKLLQIYFDRWQIEVAHKEMKQDFGLGEAQVRTAQSVKHQPGLTAATYSIMHLAAIKKFGARRVEEYGEVPKYQREKTRASGRDLIRYFRVEVINKPELLPFESKISAETLVAVAC